jgi:hypothetical protein
MAPISFIKLKVQKHEKSAALIRQVNHGDFVCPLSFLNNLRCPYDERQILRS